MNEITSVPQDEAQKKSAEIPEGMMLYPATLDYHSSDPVNVGTEDYDYYSRDAYILLPKGTMDYVVVPDGNVVSITGVEEFSVKRSGRSIEWTLIAGGVKIHDKKDFYDDSAEDDQPIAEPQWYEGPAGISTPFAIGLSAEEAVMAYKAVHPDDQSSESCPICAQVGGYCGHS